MAFSLAPARTARLFADIAAQQQQFPTPNYPVPLPCCPACRMRPLAINIKADGSRVDFNQCGHEFSLSREALLAGLRAQRSA
ncbi:hypothetical protein ACQPXT_01105 (plasmid) [Streptomyces sp. CA-100214]